MGSDTNNTHRSTKNDPLPGGRFSFWEHPTTANIRWAGRYNSPESARILRIKAADVPIADSATQQRLEKSFRDSVSSRMWYYSSSGGDGLVWSWWHGKEEPQAQHEAMSKRGEESGGWTLSSLGHSAGASAWTSRGTDKGATLYVNKEQLSLFPEELNAWFKPKLVPVTYRVQAEHRQLWLPV